VRGMAPICGFLMLSFPHMSLRYFLHDTEIVSVATMTSGINSFFTFRMRCFTFVRSLCFRIFSASFLTV